jgi:glycogen debranching enzyme
LLSGILLCSDVGSIQQGTVWPSLLGSFITANVKMSTGSNLARGQAAEWLTPLKNHLAEAGLRHISEIFEGDAPHRLVDAWLKRGAWRRFCGPMRRI